MFGKTVYGSTFKDVNFVPLQTATFCIQCELISTNSRPYCLACGNTSLLSLSRVLGGSLRNQQTAHLITDVELDSLVRDLLRTVPDPQVLDVADHHARVPSIALRSQLRVANAGHPVSGFRAVHAGEEIEFQTAELDLEPAISAITERAQHLTGATGAATRARTKFRRFIKSIIHRECHRLESLCAAFFVARAPGVPRRHSWRGPVPYTQLHCP